jgi:hypothetical protein
MNTIQATIQAMEITHERRENAVIAALEYIERGILADRIRACAALRERGEVVEDNAVAPPKPIMPRLSKWAAAARSASVAFDLLIAANQATECDTQLVNLCWELHNNAWFLEEHAEFTRHLYTGLRDLLARHGEDYRESLPTYIMRTIEALVPAAARSAPKAMDGLWGLLKRLQPKSWRHPPSLAALEEVIHPYHEAMLDMITKAIAYAAHYKRPADYVALMRVTIVGDVGWEHTWSAVNEAVAADPTLVDDRAFRTHYACIKTRVLHA